MPSLKCEKCGGENIELTSSMQDGRKRYRCSNCRHFWWNKGARGSRGAASAKFPQQHTLTPEEGAARYQMLLNRYRGQTVAPDAEERAWRDEYARLFSAEGLDIATPGQLKSFANVKHVANPGPMSVFNDAWDALGDEKAAEQLRRTIRFLVHDAETSVDDRITSVIEGRDGLGIPGFKETLTTKVLCIADRDRFLPILTSKGKQGKIPFLQHVFGVVAKPPSGASIGHVIVWSNDELAGRLRDAFPDLLDAARFLWWARTQD